MFVCTEIVKRDSDKTAESSRDVLFLQFRPGGFPFLSRAYTFDTEAFSFFLLFFYHRYEFAFPSVVCTKMFPTASVKILYGEPLITLLEARQHAEL